MEGQGGGKGGKGKGRDGDWRRHIKKCIHNYTLGTLGTILHARAWAWAFAAAEIASNFACLPDCSLPQYGLLKKILCFPVCPICSVVELCNAFLGEIL